MKLTLNEIISLENHYEVPLYPKRGIILEKGSGIYIFDIEGKRYIDSMTNIGVNILGYGNNKISEQIAKQIAILPSCHQTYYLKTRALLIKELRSILPESLSKIIFVNSGAEAIEAAIKVAHMVTGKKGFVAAKNSYHGRTLGALSATGQEKYRHQFLPLLLNFKHVAFNDIEEIEKTISSDTAAVLLEPIQGEAGVIIPQKDYLLKVKNLCKKKGVLLILDEVQTAIRTGSWLACQQFSVTPDIVCLSKSFSYGLPFGIVLINSEIASKVTKGAHGSTFAGNPVVCQAAIQVIDFIKKNNLLTNAKLVGEYFLSKLKKIKHPMIKSVRGLGLMIGLELYKNTTPYLKKMQAKGLLAASSFHNTIRFLPPITISKNEVDKIMTTLLCADF